MGVGQGSGTIRTASKWLQGAARSLGDGGAASKDATIAAADQIQRALTGLRSAATIGGPKSNAAVSLTAAQAGWNALDVNLGVLVRRQRIFLSADAMQANVNTARQALRDAIDALSQRPAGLGRAGRRY